MAYTEFGCCIRHMRMRHNEVLGDMAKLLGVSTPFLSAVENGREDVPTEWFSVLEKHYSLNKREVMEMIECAKKSL